jgi:endonuclease YncB( thermonuclease family)
MLDKFLTSFSRNSETDFPTDVYVGFKQITRTVDENKVLVEGYFNPSFNDQSKWTKQLEFVSTGSNLKVTTTHQEEQYRQACIDKGDKVANDFE